VRYDAAIIGAGADGLAAAATLARNGLKTVVIERGERAGGLLATHEFHPGFHASPYTDEVPPIPPAMHWPLDLTRRGAVFVPAPGSLAVWGDRQQVLTAQTSASLLREAAACRDDTIARAEGDIVHTPRRMLSFLRQPRTEPCHFDRWSRISLATFLARTGSNDDTRAHVAALALEGRTADPFLGGTALHALAPGTGSSGIVIGGLGRLADALRQAAEEAGAEIRFGLDVSDIRLDNGRIAGVTLADGTATDARTVISTLDVKHTFLSLFSWKVLPKAVLARAGQFRMAGATARVLIALDKAPTFAHGALPRGPVHVVPDLTHFANADLAWRAGTIPESLPVTLRLVSALDPGLAPTGKAVMTATLGAVPFRLFDGAWTKEKRDILRDRALNAAEIALPGTKGWVVAAHVIAPADMENALGATDGDLWGGEIAPDQMGDMRPWADPPPPRTPVRGLYLAGPSSPLGPLATCASGVLAARAVLADLKMASG
jgi:phytoene dehydrogenase-like protein